MVDKRPSMTLVCCEGRQCTLLLSPFNNNTVTGFKKSWNFVTESKIDALQGFWMLPFTVTVTNERNFFKEDPFK